MKVPNPVAEMEAELEPQPASENLLLALVLGQTMKTGGTHAAPAVGIGELIAITDDGTTPLVRFAGQPGTAAVPARTVVDLHGAQIGKQVVLVFEACDLAKPVILGVLRGGTDSGIAEKPGHVEVDADGERLLVNAREQLVLRCGKASITLTKAGKVLIEGTYVSNRSSGVMRVKGGSVQLN
jgi:hypothetical protein